MNTPAHRMAQARRDKIVELRAACLPVRWDNGLDTALLLAYELGKREALDAYTVPKPRAGDASSVASPAI